MIEFFDKTVKYSGEIRINLIDGEDEAYQKNLFEKVSSRCLFGTIRYLMIASMSLGKHQHQVIISKYNKDKGNQYRDCLFN